VVFNSNNALSMKELERHLDDLHNTFRMVQHPGHDEKMHLIRQQFENCMVFPNQMFCLIYFNPFNIFYGKNIKRTLGINTDTPSLDETINTIYPDDRAFFSKAINMVFNWTHSHRLARNTNIFTMEYRLQSAEGQTLFVQLNSRILETDQNNYPLALCLVTDITALQKGAFIPKAVFSDTFSRELYFFLSKDLTIDYLISAREMDVLNLLCKGFSSREIADKLFISRHTVDGHRRKLLQKTGLETSQELISFSLNHRLVEF